MFGKGKSPELEGMVDSLIRSYMRGSAHGTPAARGALVSQMRELANQLRLSGKDKAVDKARGYRPVFFTALPPDLRADFQQHLDSALG